ncbi:42956_t:CDS:2, partial [Gigaspora margarita]
ENIAKSFAQALSTSKGKEVEEAPTDQIYADSEEYNNDDMLVNINNGMGIVDEECYRVIGLACEVTLLAVDIGDSKIINILQTYITRKKNKKNTYQKDKMNENRSLQELSESINTIDEDHIISEEENYTDSDEISNDDCYTDNAIPDKE